MTCYLCSFRLSGIEGLFLWQEGEPDAVVTDDTGDIAVFRDVEALRRFTDARGLVLDDAVPVTYDLDRFAQWVAQGGSEDVDCSALLDAWNLFGDIATTGGLAWDPGTEQSLAVYDKLFWGNNLPAVTPPGEHYAPIWTEEELALLRTTLAEGLALFRRAFQMAE